MWKYCRYLCNSNPKSSCGVYNTTTTPQQSHINSTTAHLQPSYTIHIHTYSTSKHPQQNHKQTKNFTEANKQSKHIHVTENREGEVTGGEADDERRKNEAAPRRTHRRWWMAAHSGAEEDPRGSETAQPSETLARKDEHRLKRTIANQAYRTPREKKEHPGSGESLIIA